MRTLKNSLKRLSTAWTIALACGLSCAAPVQPGQPLPPLELNNQHNQPWQITEQTKLVIFASGRKASNLVMDVLAPQPAGFLQARHAVYVADLSRMPGFITRTFALPSLREQKFEVGIALEAQTLADWPREDDAVTLIQLQDGRVASYQYVRSEDHLKAILGL